MYQTGRQLLLSQKLNDFIKITSTNRHQYIVQSSKCNMASLRNEDIQQQDDGSDASSVSSEDDHSSDGGETCFVELENEDVLSQLKRNDPDVTHLRITDETSNFFHEIDWEVEGDIWGGNDQLKELDIVFSTENYMPNTFFACPNTFWMGVGRNRSIDSLTISENDLTHISVFLPSL